MAQKASGGANRGWSIAAGVLSTLQAGAYLGLAISALALYYGQIIPEKFSNSDPGSLLYVTYFYNPDFRPNPDWPNYEFPTSLRTWQWAIAYCTLDALWLFASFFLTVAGAVKSQKAIFRIVIPAFWLLVTAAVLVADIVAIVQYGIDLGKVMDAGTNKPLLALLDFIHKESPLYTELEQVTPDLAIAPSAAMLLAVGRGALLWLLNAVFFIAVFATSFKSKRKEGAAHKARQNVHPQEPASAAHGKRGGNDFSWQQHHGVQNPAYDRSDDDDAYAAKQRRRRPRDADILAAEARRASHSSSTAHDELRNQRPWSYLEPQFDEASRGRPRTPPAEEWQFTPDSTLRLPRATLGHQPSAPHHTQPPSNPQFYQYPYHEQHHGHGNRYMDMAGQNYHLSRK